MTEETKELVRWAAEFLGWVKGEEVGLTHAEGQLWHTLIQNEAKMAINPFCPDTDLNHCWLIVEKMRELGWELELSHVIAVQGILTWVRFIKEPHKTYSHSINPCHAILKAARAAKESE